MTKKALCKMALLLVFASSLIMSCDNENELRLIRVTNPSTRASDSVDVYDPSNKEYRPGGACRCEERDEN